MRTKTLIIIIAICILYGLISYFSLFGFDLFSFDSLLLVILTVFIATLLPIILMIRQMYILLDKSPKTAMKWLGGGLGYFCILGLFILITTNEKEDEKTFSKNKDIKMEQGYELILHQLKAPSQAVLIDYAISSEIKKLVEEHCYTKLSDCIEVGLFSVDAPNSFGVMLNQNFWVFYVNGKPCHIESSSSLDAVNRSREGHLLNMALEMNGCKCR